MGDTRHSWPLTEPTRSNVIELIERLARAGRSDPDIGARLSLTGRQVATLRREAGIPAGERRWLPTTVRDRGQEVTGA